MNLFTVYKLTYMFTVTLLKVLQKILGANGPSTSDQLLPYIARKQGNSHFKHLDFIPKADMDPLTTRP